MLLEKIKTRLLDIQFTEVIEFIDKTYNFTPLAYKNGDIFNEQNENNGSLKIFSFAIINQLNKRQTLNCFGEFYRKDVLLNPEKNDHQNIRNFSKYGFKGLDLNKNKIALKLK